MEGATVVDMDPGTGAGLGTCLCEFVSAMRASRVELIRGLLMRST